jgi:hypothetical protein
MAKIPHCVQRQESNSAACALRSDFPEAENARQFEFEAILWPVPIDY